MIVNGKTHLIDVRTAKGQPLPPGTVRRVEQLFARQRHPCGRELGAGSLLDRDSGRRRRNRHRAVRLQPGISPETVRKLLYQGPGFPYVMRPGAKTLVIGPGGGYDVARALAGGSKDITGVEINPIIANKIMRDRMLAESHGIYGRPEVRIVVEDGRSLCARKFGDSIRWCRRRWWTPGPPPRPARSRSRKTICILRTPSTITFRI